MIGRRGPGAGACGVLLAVGLAAGCAREREAKDASTPVPTASPAVAPVGAGADALRLAFDGDRGRVRLLFLASPT